jgi:tetratricopeptide (TPR) repeat protein
MSQTAKDDHVKMHKEANALFESGKFKDAEELFTKTADLYYKVQNYFDSTTMRYKAGEAAFALKEYEKAVEHFEKSAELSFQKGFDRFGVSALEYERDCYKSLGKKAKVKVLDKKIQEIKKKLEEAF